MPDDTTPKAKTQSRTAFDPESRRWLAALRQEGKSECTLDCYGRDLRDAATALSRILRPPITSRTLAKIGQVQANAVISAWTVEGTSVPTILRRFAALRGFAGISRSTRGSTAADFCGRSFRKSSERPNALSTPKWCRPSPVPVGNLIRLASEAESRNASVP
jgi:hypothetical protein